jgi:L-histidine N-alpha-methyltransferase
VNSPRLIQIAHDDPQAVRAELLAGLQAPVAHIAPKYLYDALGSRLFAAITELPEYYPTRTEAAIFKREMKDMARALGPVDCLVDLGAGNCEKAARLFETFRVQRYVAVDISVNFLRDSLACLQREHPEMDMLGIGTRFLAEPGAAGRGRQRAAYPVLSRLQHRQLHARRGIGLPAPGACRQPGWRAADRRRPGQADGRAGTRLRRPAGRHRRLQPQHAAAPQPLGRYRLRHRRLAPRGLLQQRRFTHRDASRSAARRNGALAGGERSFAAGERMHTENSCKWQLDDFAALLQQAGFSRLRHWTDENGWFAVFLGFA